MAQTEVWSTASQRSIPVWLPLAAALFFVGRLLAPAPGAPEEDTLVKWTDLSVAAGTARVQHKLVLYDFSAAWCGPCRRLDRVVFADVEMARSINSHFVAVRVTDRVQEDGANSKEVEGLQRRYAVTSFPTLVIADPEQHQRGKMVGFRDRKSVDDLLMSSLKPPAAGDGTGMPAR